MFFFFIFLINYLEMNPNELASLLSSVNGAPGLIPGSQRGRVLPGTSSQSGTSLLDAFAQQTPDSRPNTAPAGTRAAAPATGGTTSASSARPTGSSSSSSSKPRTGGTSSAAAGTTATAPASGTSSAASASSRPAIQMSALSNVLASLSGGNAAQGGGAAAAGGAAQPAIDLYDIMNSEVRIRISVE